MLLFSIIFNYHGISRYTEADTFNVSKTNIAFFSSENTPLVNGLKEELSKIVDFKICLMKGKSFRMPSIFARFPVLSEFLKVYRKLFKGEHVEFEKTSVLDSASNVYIDLSIDKYLNTAKL